MVERAIFERADLTAHEKLVLCYLAMRANSESECWPSYSTIASDCSISRRQAMRVVASLEEKGLLAKSNRSNDLGRFTSNLFRLFSAEAQVFPPWQDLDLEDGDSQTPPPLDGDSLSPAGDSLSLPGDSQTPTMVTASHLYEQDQKELATGNLAGPGTVPAATVEAVEGVQAAASEEQALVIARHSARPFDAASGDESSPQTTRSVGAGETAAAFMLSASTRQLERRPMRDDQIVEALDEAQQEHHRLLQDMGYDVPVLEGLVCATCSGSGSIADGRDCPACSGQPSLF